MVNVITETMKNQTKPKNLLQEEKETVKEEGTPSSPQSLDIFLDQASVDWEKKGRAYYIYPGSLEIIKKLLEKMPSPAEGEYIIIPLGSMSGFTVFIMITRASVSIRIGYGRNSIPFSTSLTTITQKVEKVAKELGIENRRNTKNLIE